MTPPIYSLVRCCLLITATQRLINRSNLCFVLCFCFIASFFAEAFAGKIIRPWRSTTAVVEQGGTFEVWYDIDSGQSINSIELKSNFVTIGDDESLNYNVQNVNVEYDFMSDNRYDRLITVTVPANTPADRYELIIKTNTGNDTSTGAVKVIQQYRDEYYVVNTSCAHRFQKGDYNNDGDENIDTDEGYKDNDAFFVLRKMSEIVKIADIMDVQLFFEAGDNMYNVRNNPEREDLYFYGYESRDIWGMHDTMAATFMTAGNHEAPFSNKVQPTDTQQSLGEFYNEYYGLHMHYHKYGNGRYLVANNGWGSHNSLNTQGDNAKAWLNANGWGNMVANVMHIMNGTSFFNRVGASQIDFSMVGHNHYIADQNPNMVGSMPQFIADSVRDAGNFEFNLFRINNSTGAWSTPSGPSARCQVVQSESSSIITNYNSWIQNLVLSHANSNDGSRTTNTATIENRYHFDIEEAKIRFVMQKGNYAITSGNGFIRQSFDTDDNKTVVDVAVDAPAGQDTVVSLGAPMENNASFVSQTVPSELNPGETRQVTITMQNSGLDPWSSGNGHILGSQNPTNNSTWGLNRVSLNQTVAPDANHTFTFNITAPNTAGVYEFSWRMNDESGDHQGWFGATTPSVFIAVGDFYDTTEEAGIFSHDAVNPPDGEGPENAIDDNNSTKYLTRSTSAYLQYQYSGGFQHVCKAFSITSANDEPSRDPVTAVIKGSNNGTSWTTLGSYNGMVFSSRFERQFFGFSNSTAYEYYRIEMTNNNGYDQLQLAEVEFLAVGTGPLNPPGPMLDPVRIQAENYDAMFGVGTQSTGDAGGGLNIKDVDAGDWLDYNVTLPTSGIYEFRFRVASQTRGSNFDFKQGGTTLFSINDPATGDFQIYRTVVAYANMTAGSTTLRIEATDRSWNINWWEYVAPGDSGNALPVITSTPSTSVQEGNAYSYTLTATDADGDSLTFSAPTRPSWLNFNTGSGVLSGTPNSGHVGSHPVTLRVDDGTAFREQNFSIEVTSSQPPTGDPIRIEAENYDAMFGIGTQNTGDTGGGQNVKDIHTGDWVDYNITLPTSGTYEARFRVASLTRGMQFDFMEGSTVLASFDEPATGDWQLYTTVSSNVTLSAGSTTLRVFATDSNWNFNWFELVPPAPVSNTAPDITSSPSLSVNEGDNYSYTLTATDADGDNITYSYITKPDWLNFNAGTGVLSGIPYGNRVGNHNVTLRASDGTDHDDQSFVINVVASPVPLGPEGYIYCADEHQNFTLPQASDLAYGAYGQFVYLTNQTGTITFNNPTFGSDPISGVGKYGFYRIITDNAAPTPNPASFSVVPNATGTDTITMTSITGSDINGVEYYFEETTGNAGGSDSGWQSSPTYTNTGLQSSTQYGYRVRMRDSLGNETSRSITRLVSTQTPADNTAPNPNPMSFAIAPAPVQGDPLGVLTAATLSGNNPATGSAWAPGDTYRVIFLSSTTRDATSHNIADYNAFAQSVADAAGLGAATWNVIGSTGTVDARDNTGTNTSVNGSGEAIFLVDGSTVVANNYADLWDGSVDVAIDVDENGVGGMDVSPATGSTANGIARDRHLGGSDEATPKIEYGDSTKTSGQWALIYNGLPTGQYHFYVLSDPITIVDPSGDPETQITMTATTATDVSGVEYYFTETSGNPGGSDSGWQSSPTYTDSGLSPNTQYTYTVRARDLSASQNTTSASAAASATTAGGSINDYDQWKLDNNVTDDLGDEDNDGVENIMEYALGGNPRSAAGEQRPTVAENASDFAYTFPRAKSNITYTVERSVDLINWTNPVTVTDSHGLVGGNATVLIPQSAMSNGKLFFRLKVED